MLKDMNTYTWKIENLDYAVSTEGQSNVINNIHWRLIGNSNKGESTTLIDGSVLLTPFTSQTYGSQAIEHNNKDVFIDYDKLTEDEVIGWLEAAMGSEQITQLKSAIDAQIEAQANPTTGSGLPWAN